MDGKSLLSGALEGLVATLDDRHTLYLGGDDFREFTESTNAAYGGIGIYLSQTDEKKPFVAGLMEGILGRDVRTARSQNRQAMVFRGERTPGLRPTASRRCDAEKKEEGPWLRQRS